MTVLLKIVAKGTGWLATKRKVSPIASTDNHIVGFTMFGSPNSFDVVKPTPKSNNVDADNNRNTSGRITNKWFSNNVETFIKTINYMHIIEGFSIRLLEAFDPSLSTLIEGSLPK
jgi:hypothetical protein